MKRKHSAFASGSEFAFGLQTNKGLGQHFLRDAEVIEGIVRAADAALTERAPRRCVEIGPGSGALTHSLLKSGWNVLALEKDVRAVEGLRQTLGVAHADAFQVVTTDVLKWRPEDTDRPLCVGNLPYYITSDILFWFSAFASVFQAGLFMIQDEVADRLCARPGTKDYGRLSVRMQLGFSIEKLMFVPASAFVPPPKVNSAVVRLVPRPGFAFASAERERHFSAFTTTLFSARRKMLRRALVASLTALAHRNAALPDAFWDFARARGIEPEARPDTLSPEIIQDFEEFFWNAKEGSTAL